MLTGLTKPVLSPVSKHRETTVLKIQCIVTRQWLKLHMANFHMFYANSLPSRSSTVQENQAANFPAILDSCLLGGECIRQVTDPVMQYL